MEMDFSAGVVFIWGWIWRELLKQGMIWLRWAVLGRWPQTHSHSERDLKIGMLPAWGCPGERLELFFAAFLLDSGSAPALWLLSSSQTWHVAFSCMQPVCKWCSSWGRQREFNREKASVFSAFFLFSFPVAPARTNICTFGVESTKQGLRRNLLIRLGFSLGSDWGFTIF